jgi:hypothetical protein
MQPKMAPLAANPKRIVQRMMISPTLGMGGASGGSGGDDRKQPWHPDHKTGPLFQVPRTARGGKHFIPANWIDRLISLAVHNAGTIGRMEQMMSEMQDILGDEAPLELSKYYYTRSTQKSGSHYASLDNKGETGFLQVFGNLRDNMREWPQNVFPNGIKSSGDKGGRAIDQPKNASVQLRRRLAEATVQMILFFDKWCYAGTVLIPVEGQDREMTWAQLRLQIMIGLGTLVEQGGLL